MSGNNYAGRVMRIDYLGGCVIVMRLTRVRYSVRRYVGKKLVQTELRVGLTSSRVCAYSIAEKSVTVRLIVS